MLAGELIGGYSLSEPQAGLGRGGAALPGAAQRRRGLRHHRREGLDHPRRAGRLLRALRAHGRGQPRGLLLPRTGPDRGPDLREARGEDGPARHPDDERHLGRRRHRRRPADRRRGPGAPDRVRRARQRPARDRGRAPTGLAQAALDAAVDYANERQTFGKKIVDHQGLGFLLADMAAAVDSARATYLDAARRRDAGVAYGRQASVAKLVATDAAMKVTTDAVQVLGGARLHPRLPGRAVHARGQDHADLRGHQPDPAPRDQPPLRPLTPRGPAGPVGRVAQDGRR